MPNPNFRIVIPSNPQQLIALSERIIAKHIADGGSSVLTALNMADMSTKTKDAYKEIINLETLNLNN